MSLQQNDCNQNKVLKMQIKPSQYSLKYIFASVPDQKLTGSDILRVKMPKISRLPVKVHQKVSDSTIFWAKITLL